MAELIITVPDDKVVLVIAAVEDHLSLTTGEPVTLTPAETVVWVTNMLSKNLQGFVQQYQRQVYESAFVLDDPLEE